MLVVADTSALVALAACEALSHLDRLFGEIRVPRGVFRECTVPGKFKAEQLASFLRGKVVEVDLNQLVIAAPGLGNGELEAMALYKRIHADLLLVDDHRARAVARLNDMGVVGSLGVLLRAKEVGYISALAPLVIEIKAAGIRYSNRLVDEALRLAGEA